MINITLSEKLKELRINKNLSQYELAKELGITSRAIRNYESGERAPRTDVLKKYGEYFKISYDYFFDDKEGDADEIEDIILRLNTLFAGGKLDKESKEKVMIAIKEIYEESLD